MNFPQIYFPCARSMISWEIIEGPSTGLALLHVFTCGRLHSQSHNIYWLQVRVHVFLLLLVNIANCLTYAFFHFFSQNEDRRAPPIWLAFWVQSLQVHIQNSSVRLLSSQCVSFISSSKEQPTRCIDQPLPISRQGNYSVQTRFDQVLNHGSISSFRVERMTAKREVPDLRTSIPRTSRPEISLGSKNNWEMKSLPLPWKWLGLRVARMPTLIWWSLAGK